MAAFEVFKRTEFRSGNSNPQVTIAQRGIFGLNQAAYAALGSPDAVEYLFDSDANEIGLRAIVVEAATAYRLRKSGNTYRSRASAFATHCKIDTSHGRRYDAEMRDDILCISVKEGDGIPVTSNRTKKK